jgi:hypothetical protein
MVMPRAPVKAFENEFRYQVMIIMQTPGTVKEK